MRLSFPFQSNQALFVLVLLLFLQFVPGCRRTQGELPVTPPLTHPLSREYIGYGVVNVTFTHLLNEPGPGGISRGYLRRGTVVRVKERRPVLNGGENSESWVLAEGNYEDLSTLSSGWLPEAAVDIYDNESRALTASKGMNR